MSNTDVRGDSHVWHPWIRVSPVIQGILGIRWDSETWPLARMMLRDAIKSGARYSARAGLTAVGMRKKQPATTPKRKVIHVPIQTKTQICSFCSKPIAADARIRRFHELTVHEACWQREAR